MQHIVVQEDSSYQGSATAAKALTPGSACHAILRLGFKVLRRPPLEQELPGKSILTAMGWWAPSSAMS